MPYAPYKKLGSFQENQKTITPGGTKQTTSNTIPAKRNKTRRKLVMNTIKRNV